MKFRIEFSVREFWVGLIINKDPDYSMNGEWYIEHRVCIIPMFPIVIRMRVDIDDWNERKADKFDKKHGVGLRPCLVDESGNPVIIDSVACRECWEEMEVGGVCHACGFSDDSRLTKEKGDDE